MHSLSDRERIVLTTLNLHADISFSEAARRLNMHVRLLRGLVERLHADGVVFPYLEIDPLHLGRVEYLVQISLHSAALSRAAAIAAFRSMPEVSWIAEYSGRYDLEVSFWLAESDNVFEILSKLDSERVLFREFTVGRRLEYRTFQRMLTPLHGKTRESLGYGLGGAAAGGQNRRLLEFLRFRPRASLSLLQAETGMPRSTLDYQRRALWESGAIAGAIWGLNHSKVGIQACRLVANIQPLTLELRRRILDFCRQCTDVLSIGFLYGPWSTTITLEPAGPREVRSWLSQFLRHFGKYVDEHALLLQCTQERVTPGSAS